MQKLNEKVQTFLWVETKEEEEVQRRQETLCFRILRKSIDMIDNPRQQQRKERTESLERIFIPVLKYFLHQNKQTKQNKQTNKRKEKDSILFTKPLFTKVKNTCSCLAQLLI